jgi:putative MATE family efflux protein
MRQRLRQILVLSIPVAGAQLSQSLFSLVDTAMIGTLGPVSLAAVGLAGFANFIAVSVVTGLSTGVQTLTGRRLGQSGRSATYPILAGGIVLSLAVGIPLSFFLFWATPIIFPVLNGDAGIIAEGGPYLQARLVGLAAVGVAMVYRGYLTGIQNPMGYLRCLILMHVVNVALNYGLIFGHWGLPALGSLGAGIGTTIAVFIGLAYYWALTRKQIGADNATWGLPSRDTLRTMVRLSLPSSTQLVLFALGFEVLLWIIGAIGTNELAAANVLIVVTLVGMRLGLSLGLASASLVSHAMGQENYTAARQWGRDTVLVGAIIMTVMGAPLIIAPDLILGIFLHEADTVALARLPMMLVGVGFILDGVGIVLFNSMLGAGASRQAMTISISLQWLLFLPLAWCVGLYLGYGLTGIWVCFAAYRLVQALVFASLWEVAKWQAIRI